jgi:hypothetical protein
MTASARTALLTAMLIVTASPAVAAPAGGPGFTIVDQRPAREKKDRLWSVWIWDCNFGVFNIGDGGIGDERLARDRLGDLRRYLEGRLEDRLAGRSLVLSTYRIIVNGNARAKAFSTGGTIFETSGKTRKPKCSREDMAAGWFDMSELANANSPMIVEIAGSVDGKPVSGRAVHSPARELFKEVTLKRMYPADLAEFRQTIEAACGALAESIAAALPAS